MCANSSKNVKIIISIFHFWSVKMDAGQIFQHQIGPKSNRPQVKIIEELKLFSKYSYVLYQ